MVDPSADFFALLGLPRRYGIDREQLEQRYLELAAQVHPDRVAGESSRAQREAMEASAAVNEAYRVLRDSVRRAEYLVKLGGIDLDSSDPVTGAPAMGQAFLVEMIERREALEQARARGESALEQFAEQVEDEADEVLQRAIGALQADDVRAAAEALVVRRYLQRLLDEVEGDVE